MAYKNNISRLSRLIAIIAKLQAHSKINVIDLAHTFQVSTRTIYRDLEALSAAGIPLLSDESGHYSLMDGYHLPPISFTEGEAHAIIMAEKMVAQTRDSSLIHMLGSAVEKLKAVMAWDQKESTELLANRTIIGKNWNNEKSSNHLSTIQQALTRFQVIRIVYKSEGDNKTTREIEPFAVYHNPAEYWVVIAWCRLRSDFRNFRLDRIERLERTPILFRPHSITLDEYVEIQRKKHFKED